MKLKLTLVLSFFFFLLLITLLFAGYGLWHTQYMFKNLAQYDLVKAETHLQKSLVVSNSLSNLTGQKSADIELWRRSLLAAESGLEIVTFFQSHSSSFLTNSNDISLLPMQHPISVLTTQLKEIEILWPQSFFAQRFFSSSVPDFLPVVQEVAEHLDSLLLDMSKKKTHLLVLLQNSDELRATGGFMGSYVLIPFENGVMRDVIVEDIYDADGQFTGFIPAPPGVDEYLSSQKGLRLPDANWSPDFPTSAETALRFFALGNKRDIGFVTAITSSFVSDVVAITGPLALPDYDLIVTSSNFSQTLRSNRDEFFPGNVQKKHIISQLITQIKATLSNSTSEEYQRLYQAISEGIQSKDIQFFSLNTDIQNQWSYYDITGDLYSAEFMQIANKCNCSPFFLGSVESNVGINKINPFIERNIAIDIQNNQPTVTMVLENKAEPFLNQERTALAKLTNEEKIHQETSRQYVNYHRFFLDTHTTLKSLTVNGSAVSSWDEEIITTYSGKQLKQIGFLVTVPAKTNSIIIAELDINKPTLPSYLFLSKQAATKPQYVVHFRDKQSEFMLTENTAINLLEFDQ